MADSAGSWLERAPLGGPQLGILDTNTIFNDLIYQLRQGREEGKMLTSARVGAVRLFASSHIFEEVYKRAPEQGRRGFATEQMLDLFERRYLPRICFVDVTGLQPEARALAVRDADPDDLPTAQLALLLAPCHVFTDDRDLTEAGFGQERNWLSLIRSAERTMQVDQTVLVIAELAKWGWRKLAPWVNRQPRETGPGEVILGAAIGMLAFSVLPAAGQVRLGQAIDAGERFIAGAGEIGASAGLGLLGERARQSGYLLESLVLAEKAPSLEARVARALALQGPLGVEELSEIARSSHGEVEALLAALPCFVRETSGWCLGTRLLGRGLQADPRPG